MDRQQPKRSDVSMPHGGLSKGGEEPYHPSLRYLQFTFERDGKNYAYDLVIDDSALREGDAPVDLNFLGSKDTLSREFTVMTLQGAELRSALPAILVQAGGDPSTAVRLQAIYALGRILGLSEPAQEQERESIRETLQQIYKSPNTIPTEFRSSITEERQDEDNDNRLFSAEDSDALRSAALIALTQFPDDKLKPPILTLLSMYGQLGEGPLKQGMLSTINESVEQTPDILMKAAQIRNLIDHVTTLSLSDGKSLCKMLARHEPAVVESQLCALLSQCGGQEGAKLLDIFVEVSQNPIETQEYLDHLFLNHASLDLRFYVVSKGISESALLKGLESGIERVREIASSALVAQEISQQGLLGLMSRLRGSYDPHTQLASAEVLRQVEDTTIISEQLVLALEHRNDLVAKYCAQALASSTDLSEAFSVVEDTLRNPYKENKAPYLHFLTALHPEEVFIQTSILETVGMVVKDSSCHLNLRKEGIVFIANHAQEFDRERLLQILREQVGLSLQQFIDTILEEHEER